MRFLVDECTGPTVAAWLRHQNRGVILLRLDDERPMSKIQTISRLLKNYMDRLPDSFVVVTEKQVRFARKQL